jgi:hypothetical protein
MECWGNAVKSIIPVLQYSNQANPLHARRVLFALYLPASAQQTTKIPRIRYLCRS